MKKPLSGKSALVTGGSRGIGAAIAKRLADEGAQVTLTYVGAQSAADEVVTRIKDSGGSAHAVKADVSMTGTAQEVVAEMIDRQGGLDILVSNAGVNIPKPIEALTDEDYETVFGVNVRGAYDIIRAAASEMQTGGRIVLISATIANHFFAPGLALYGASKAAANALVQGWARDLGARGITINAVLPGPIDTDMNPANTDLAAQLKQMVPLGRYGRPEEIAAMATFLAGPEASYINGARIIIDGGMNV